MNDHSKQKSDKIEFRLDGNPREAHCGALLEVPEDCHWLRSGVDVSFDTRAVAVRHIFHQFGMWKRCMLLSIA